MKNIKFKTKNPLLVVVIVLGIIAFISGCYAFSSWVVMTLFNLVAAYFGWKKITFIISLIIVILLSVVGQILHPNSSNKK
jgi:uncharacterized membrane protein